MSDALRQPAIADDDRRAIDRLVASARARVSGDVAGALHDAESAAERAATVGYSLGRARALRAVGDCYSRLGHHDPARHALDEAVALFAAASDAAGESDARTVLGGVEYLAARYDAALEQFVQALSLSRDASDRLLESNALNGCATTHHALGDYRRATEAYLESLAIKREVGDRATEAGTLSNLGLIYQELGDHMTASKLHQEALEIKREIGDRTGEANVMTNLGVDLYQLGLAGEARKLHEEALRIARDVGSRRIEAACLENLGLVAAALGEPEAALRLFGQAIELQREVGNELGETSGTIESAKARMWLGDHETAVGELTRALEMALRLRSRRFAIEAHRSLAEALEAIGDLPAALRHLRQAADGDRELLREQVDRSTAGLLAGFQVDRAQRETAIERQRSDDLEAANAALRLANEETERLVEQLRAQQGALERTASTDGLTGLLNRRAMEDELDKRFKEARRYGRELCVALIDLDHFKQVNDLSRSHRVGDEVLRIVADLMRETAREVDLIARWGGEEFALCFLSTTREAAFAAAERLRAAVEGHPWSIIHPGISVTMSAGLAGSGEANTADELFFLADERLYEAKEQGRNQVCW